MDLKIGSENLGFDPNPEGPSNSLGLPPPHNEPFSPPPKSVDTFQSPFELPHQEIAGKVANSLPPPQINVEAPAGNGHTLNANDSFPSTKQPLDEKNGSNYNDEKKKIEDDVETGAPKRMQWDNGTEFLMSCISSSVGLGNVWRFPFVAYQNGGGAFLIPYIIVLFVVGKPMYYLETAMGQFSSKNCIKVWSISPGFRGTGVAQTLGAVYLVSYYVSIQALCLFYMAMSFGSVLPWSVCQPEWGPNCVDSSSVVNLTEVTNAVSSAELYFLQVVLKQSNGIHDGIGLPNWDLTLCLLASWFVIFIVVCRGVKSSGKAAYFLALFPYVVLIILLIRAVTLEEASKGILFFITPQWDKLYDINVWYAAVTQVFFSLSVCSGTLIMFSSYNGFRQNIYRDSMIVTTLDTFTSLIAGFTIFAILGNLAHQLGYDDISQVIGSGGTGLAFISYPDAIAKSPFLPQVFSVLFFVMMFVLGVGSAIALLSCLNTTLLDAFPRIPVVFIALGTCVAGFLGGLVYVTPGGQYILELVDYYGGTFMRLFAAVFEVTAIFWIYGLERFCIDLEFMLKRKTGLYWRFCWGLVTPVLMIVVMVYGLFSIQRIVFGDGYVYPDEAYYAGFALQASGIVMIPIFISVALYKYRGGGIKETIKRAFRPTKSWGPQVPSIKQEYLAYSRQAKEERKAKTTSWFKHIWYSLTGGYRRNVKLD